MIKNITFTLFFYLFFVTTTNAAWTAAEISNCKAQITREYNSQCKYIIDGVAQTEAACQPGYSNALARCDASQFVVFQSYYWLSDQNWNKTGQENHVSLFKSSKSAYKSQAFYLTYHKADSTTLPLMHCYIKAGNTSIFGDFVTNDPDCEGQPLSWFRDYYLITVHLQGNTYAQHMGFSLTDTTSSIPLYRCKRTEYQYNHVTNVYENVVNRYLSFNASCSITTYDGSTVYGTNLGMLGYSIPTNQASWN